MEIRIFDRTKEKSVIERGNYSLGALNEDDVLEGVLDFYIGVMIDRVCYARIQHLFVEPEFRREGVGVTLLEEMHRILERSGIKEVQVFVPEENDETFEIREFFRHRGYTFNGETVREYRGKLAELVKKNYRRKVPELKVKPLVQLEPEKFLPMLSRIMDQTQNTEGEYAVSAELETDINAYNQEVSTFYSGKNTEGVFLVRNAGENVVEQVYFRAYGEQAESLRPALALTAVKCAQLVLDPETYVLLAKEDPETKKIMEELLPDTSPVVSAKGVWQEELAAR